MSTAAAASRQASGKKKGHVRVLRPTPTPRPRTPADWKTLDTPHTTGQLIRKSKMHARTSAKASHCYIPSLDKLTK
jgi:hypothetical protein